MANQAHKFNLRNPAVKRIMQEIKEMQAETSQDFIADALEDDIFEWHFVVRGPPDTEFEGGIYHGRILLPAEYPFKPPSFMMLTPNGRFQTNVKVCLSISSHHPEHWQPSWSVRTALTALIAFMPTPGQGALGSLDFTKEERQQLAVKSRTEVPKFGSAARQKVINEMHQRMMDLQQEAATSSSKASEATAAPGGADAADATVGSAQDSHKQQQALVQQQLQQQQQQQQQLLEMHQHEDRDADSSDSRPVQDNNRSSTRDTVNKKSPSSTAVAAATVAHPSAPAAAAAAAPQASAPAGAAPVAAVSAAAVPVMAAAVAGRQVQFARAGAAVGSRPGELPGDRGLTFLIVVLSVAIAAMLLKKVMTAVGAYRLMV